GGAIAIEFQYIAPRSAFWQRLGALQKHRLDEHGFRFRQQLQFAADARRFERHPYILSARRELFRGANSEGSNRRFSPVRSLRAELASRSHPATLGPV